MTAPANLTQKSLDEIDTDAAFILRRLDHERDTVIRIELWRQLTEIVNEMVLRELHITGNVIKLQAA